MVRSLELQSYLFSGILSQCLSEEPPKYDFSDRNLFQIFRQHLYDIVIQPIFSYEAPSINKMAALDNCE